MSVGFLLILIFLSLSWSVAFLLNQRYQVPHLQISLLSPRIPRILDSTQINKLTNVILQSSKSSQGNDSKSKDNKMTFSGLVQLILMGAGAPGLGEYKGTDPTTGKMMFELEANNFINSKGEDLQTKAKFFQDGWVEGSEDSKAVEKAPGFFKNLLSGGRLQEEWDKRNRISK